MDITAVALGFVKDLTLLFIVFGALFAYSLVRGQRSLLSVVLGLYLALLISLEFPYYEKLLQVMTFAKEAVVRITLFAIFTAFTSVIFERILSRLIDESAIEGIRKKVVLSILGTALIMAYCYHVIPITEVIDPGARVGALFAPQEYFFWWLLLPLFGIFFVF